MARSLPSRYFCALLGVLPVLLLGSLAQAQLLGPVSHQVWSTEEGLPSPGVHQIFQARNGYIWLATEGGAVRFDGVAFKTFQHDTEPAFTSNDISSIAEDAAGTMWFGTADGLLALREEGFERFGSDEGLTSTDVLTVAAAKDGSLLVLTGEGVFRFDGSRFQALSHIPANVSALDTDGDGNVWLLTAHSAYLYSGNGITTSKLDLSVREPLMQVITTKGAARYARTARTVSASTAGVLREVKAGGALPARKITALLVDREAHAWIGTAQGLYVWISPQDTKVREVPELRSEQVASLFEDREGDLWVGTEGSGLHVFRPRAFRSEPAASGEAVTAVQQASDGAIWFGTRDRGVHSIRNGEVQSAVLPAELTSARVLALARGVDNEIWVGTPDGLNHIRGHQVDQLTATDGLPDDFVRSVLVDVHGAVWAGTRSGLARIANGVITVMTRRNGLGSDSIGPLLETRSQNRSTLWVGTSNGLSRVRDGGFKTYAAAGSSGGIVTALATDEASRVWVGVHGAGLSLLQGERLEPISASSLPNEILAIAADRAGFLWLRGERSLYRVRATAAAACAGQSVCSLASTMYTSADGLPSNEVAGPGFPLMVRGATGDMWVATRKGLGVANPAAIRDESAPPPVVLQRFLVDEQDEPSRSNELTIRPGHNRFVFEFAALSFISPSKNRYRYKLDGFDSGWTDAGATRSASYTNLPPRHYVFRVQAQGGDGVWNEAGASVAFRVLPPFYRRLWFFLTCALLIAALGYGIYLLRVRSIERRFRLVLNERNRVAREVHDTLAQDFVSVSLQIDIATSLLKANQSEAAAEQLRSTRQLVKDGLEEARQSIWNLRANTAETSLPARLTALVKKYAGAQHPPRLKMGGAYHAVASHIEDEVFRVAQESLSNVERHAEADDVRIELHYESTALRLTVRDNGNGFSTEDADRLQGHYGVRGIKERASALGGTISIQSEPGLGTTVTLYVPLPAGEGARA